MALPLGKLAILVGAGIAGSVLAKEGRISTVSDFFSGAFKIVLRQISHDDSTPSSAKPRNNSLLAQVNSLRQELQLLASNRSVTIVTSSGSGSSRYGIIVVVIVVGYGWWKGWKLPEVLRFATRRTLSDACNTIAKQLENVYSSITATNRHVSSRIDRVDHNLDECAELTASTRDEVSELQGEMRVIGADVQSVHHVVQTLETKINRIEGKQDLTIEGVRRLVGYACSLENNRTTERVQEAPSSSSRPVLEMPQMTPSPRSLPPIPSVEPPSPSASIGSHKQLLQTAASASGLKDLHGISGVVDALSSPEVSAGFRATEDANNRYSGSGLFKRKLSGISATFLTRTRSAVQSFK